MAESGLSYDQGPPFGAPLRYFLVAPLFILLAACLGIFMPDWLTTRWSPVSLALTHLITLGYLAMVMLGAFLSAPIDRYASIAGHLLLVASAIRQWLYLLQAKHLFLKHGGYLD